MLKTIQLFTFLLCLTNMANATNNKIINENKSLYLAFKQNNSKDIIENNANERDIQDAFEQLYSYDKFDIMFKIKFYINYFKNDSVWVNAKLNNNHIIALVAYVLKADVFNSTAKYYKNDFKFLGENQHKLIALAMEENCKIKFVNSREEMIELEKNDIENKINYIPKECYQHIEYQINK